MVPRVELRVCRYDDPDAVLLTAEVQQEYVRRYGGPDQTPIDAAEFADPHGVFVVAYLDERPVAMGGWRRIGMNSRPGLNDGPGADRAVSNIAEIKRMYVRPDARGHGVARALLALLERTAAESGAWQLILETGTRQPEAIALYSSSGYEPVAPFGYHADTDHSIHLGKRLDTPAPR